MFNVSTIKRLYGLVGVKQPADPNYQLLDSDNQNSDSGIYVNDISPYFKVPLLYDAANDYAGISQADFNSWLKELQENSILRVCRELYSGADVVENKLLFDDTQDQWYELDNDGDFVGYSIDLPDNKNISVTINKAYCYFEGSGTIKLLLLNQFSKSVLQSQEIAVEDETVTPQVLNWTLPYQDDLAKGRYYIGYLTQGLIVKALNGYRSQNHFRNIRVCEGKVTGWNKEEIFEELDFVGAGLDYGLNFDISINRDHTPIVVNNKHKFARAVAIDMCINGIKAYMASLRGNVNEQRSKEIADQLVFEIEGNPDLRIYGLKGEYKKEIDNLKKSFYKGHKITVLQK